MSRTETKDGLAGLWQLATDAGRVVGGNLAASIAGLIGSMIATRWIPPRDMGIWQIASTVALYIGFLHLGAFSGLNRELPFLTGAGRDNEVRRLAGAAKAWAIWLTEISLFATVAATVWLWWHSGSRVAETTMAVGVLVSTGWLTNYFSTTYKSFADFGALARVNVIGAVIGLALTVPIAFLGYAAMLIKVSAVALVTSFLLARSAPLRVGAKWDRQALTGLIKTGVPIFGLGQLAGVIGSLDRVALSSSVEAIGLFTLAVQVQTAARLLTTAISVAVYPRMAVLWGQGQTARRIWATAATAFLLSLLVCTAVAAIGWVLLPYFVAIVAPKYADGLAAARWSLFLASAYSLSLFDNVFNVLKAQHFYLVSWIIGVAAFWLSWSSSAHLEPGQMAAVAARSMIAATLASGICSAILSYSVCWRMGAIRASGL